MIFRIFIILAGLLCAFLIYDSARLMLAKSAMTKAEASYVLGPEQADLTVVEFLDYTCGACREVHAPVMRALERDSNIRYIPRPLPAYQLESGADPAVLAYAAGEQGKFLDAHQILIENYRVIDEPYIEQFVQILDLDADKFRADIENEDVKAMSEKNRKYMQTLKMDSVPTFLIGDRILLVVGGDSVSTETFLGWFNKAREL